MMKLTKEYVYKSTLRDVYGLTPSMIDELDPTDIDDIINSLQEAGAW
jgi:hypothetical protein